MKKLLVVLSLAVLPLSASAELNKEMGMPIGNINGNSTYSKLPNKSYRYKYNGVGGQEVINRNRLISRPGRRFTDPFSNQFGGEVNTGYHAPNLQPNINRETTSQETTTSREYRMQMREGRRDWR